MSLLHHIAQASAGANAPQAFYAPATTPTASFSTGGFNHASPSSWSRDESTSFEPNTRRRNPGLARSPSLVRPHYAYTTVHEDVYEGVETTADGINSSNTVENGAGIAGSQMNGNGMDWDECVEITDKDKAQTQVIAGGWFPGDRNPTGSLVQTTPFSEYPSTNDRRSLQSGWDLPSSSANPTGLDSISTASNSNSNNNCFNVFLESNPSASQASSFAASDPFYLSVAQLAAAADCRRKLEPKPFAVTSPLRFTPNPVEFGSLHPQQSFQSPPAFNQYQAQTAYQQQPPPDPWARRNELDPTMLQYR